MIEKQDTSWSKAAVFVCTKCHKTISDDTLKEEGNCGENLKNYLKSQMRDAGKGREVRVMTSSCLDICEPETQAISIARVNGETTTLTLHPETDRAQILEVLKNL